MQILSKLYTAMTASFLLALTGCGAFQGGTSYDLSAEQLRSDDAWSMTLTRLETQQERDPSEPYWSFQIGRLASRSGRLDQAEDAWQTAIAIRSDYAPAVSALTKKLYGEDRHLEAIEILEGICASPNGCREELLAALALHYEALGQQERAEDLLRPYRAHGDHWKSMGASITYLTLQGDSFQEAPRLAERALASLPASAANCNNFGIGLLQEGQPEEARRYFLKALELEPDRAGPLYNLAIVEKFYFFNDKESARYFSLYRSQSEQDPDGLAELFGDAFGSVSGDGRGGSFPDEAGKPEGGDDRDTGKGGPR